MRTMLNRLFLILTMLLIAPLAHAQAPYPTKPVRLIIPYPPAGTTDFVGRIVGQKMGEGLGQQVLIDNRPGAGTLLGLGQGAKAAPDGYTIIFGTSAGLAVLPALGAKMTFDPQKDFVHPSLPVKNIKEFVALAKANPGKLNFASPGVGTPNHLGIELLSMMTGVKFVHVPYKGGALAVTDLVAGQVQAFFSGTPQVSAFTRTGRLKVIAVGTQKPTKVAPEYAPIADTYPGFDCNTWFGLLAPAATPPAIVSRLSAELNKAITDSTTQQRLIEQGVEATPGSPDVLRQLIVSETARWSKVIKAAGITAEAAQ